MSVNTGKMVPKNENVSTTRESDIHDMLKMKTTHLPLIKFTNMKSQNAINFTKPLKNITNKLETTTLSQFQQSETLIRNILSEKNAKNRNRIRNCKSLEQSTFPSWSNSQNQTKTNSSFISDKKLSGFIQKAHNIISFHKTEQSDGLSSKGLVNGKSSLKHAYTTKVRYLVAMFYLIDYKIYTSYKTVPKHSNK